MILSLVGNAHPTSARLLKVVQDPHEKNENGATTGGLPLQAVFVRKSWLFFSLYPSQ
ncbi:MAG TPA: hypothetical protein V6C85_02630 [Allocoleopsis sp.]